jgi:putative hemolysin
VNLSASRERLSASYEIGIARTERDVEAASRVRHAVFVEEAGALGHLVTTAGIETVDVDRHATHLVARDHGRVIGTVRVQEPTPALADGRRPIFGMAGEEHYDYAPLRDAGLRFVEIGRSAVLRAHRSPRVIADLWKAAVLLANRRGKDHFIGVVHINFTDSLDDARIVHAKLARDGALHPRFDLRSRSKASPPERAEYPILSDAERAAPESVSLPSLFTLFRRIGLRACSAPVFMADTRRVGLGMLAGPDTFPPETKRFFATPDPAIRLD